ncbi:aminotransferase class I/II-fold pyridoxal phosphate-dependent enzyme [Halobacillus litoralis]|uniref:aminotransferase class I/II-fold pyridoxal phosphate-dependent enzyme n=1 Tax=Halobacillus litoralis TaxID=45668 RepID=UPI00273FBB3F|nr:aminotransferase class I/II-fold pyridoxal phosphate-dependent enzyme [Halobacillus litoralis]WLR46472.1 aminotransferase class I/II-fold pyridoxal phosphate-dependent enzyme [Halobacillus litoralis]
MIQSSKQVRSLPPYLFSIFHKKKVALTAQGVDVIDLGIGAPDLPTPPFIIDRLTEEVRKPKNHKYSPYGGCREFREAVADFYRSHYDVDLDPETEVLTLIGSKEGIAHLISAVLDPRDGVLAPDPGYPVYQSAIHLAHGVTVRFPLDEENSYAPMFDQISPRDVSRSKMMLLNYPNNPTGGTVDVDTFEEAVRFAKEHQLSLIHDAAYDLVTFGDYKAPSLLQVPGAKEIGVEFGSLSKTFNMSGWRLGYIVGNKELIRSLSVYKSNMDTSQFLPVQLAGATALRSDFSSVRANNRTYEQRLDLMMSAFNGMNISAEKPKGTFFLWARVPDGYTSQGFSEKMLDEAGIILTPGTAFGQKGEGYFRMSLSVPIERLHEASIRMKKAMKGG